jgi:8-oxo-dGTP diphosphatase
MIDASMLEKLTIQAANDGVQQLVVGAIVQDENKVLLLKRPEDDFMGGTFELPSGKVEGDETLDVALIREVDEETGLAITDIREYLGGFDYTSGSGKKSRQFIFTVSVADAEQIELTEYDAYLWAPLDDDLPVTDAVNEIFEKHRQLRAV